ncbi:hypothetical protein ACIP96_05940 [Streptomyces nigra]|uniref:hypothetical protein n=1 Tax=Streptomyces nigra TaxID=1827580 RepID=UPI003812BF25
MPEETRRADVQGTVDAAVLRRTVTARAWWAGIRSGGIFAVMAFGAPALTGVVRDSAWPWLVYVVAPFTGVGIIGLISMLKSIPVAVLLTRACRRTLARYPVDGFWPVIEKVDGAEGGKRRSKALTFRLRTAEGEESPVMRMQPVPRRAVWRGPWPECMDSGVYVAGDLAFGAVGYVPASGGFFFMQPDDWDACAQERRVAGGDRAGRARGAGVDRRII